MFSQDCSFLGAVSPLVHLSLGLAPALLAAGVCIRAVVSATYGSSPLLLTEQVRPLYFVLIRCACRKGRVPRHKAIASYVCLPSWEQGFFQGNKISCRRLLCEAVVLLGEFESSALMD